MGGVSSGPLPLSPIITEADESVDSRQNSNEMFSEDRELADANISSSGVTPASEWVDACGPTTEVFSVEGRDVGDPDKMEVRFLMM